MGTIEVLGLHGSEVGTISKSEVNSHVRREDSAQSSNGVIFGFILQSGFAGSQLYSERETSDKSNNELGDCHSFAIVTRTGSMISTTGLFFRRIVRVWSRLEVFFSRIFIVSICSPVGTMEVFGLHGSLAEGTSVKPAVISQVSLEDDIPSKRGVTFGLILHSGFDGSQEYSVR